MLKTHKSINQSRRFLLVSSYFQILDNLSVSLETTSLKIWSRWVGFTLTQTTLDFSRCYQATQKYLKKWVKQLPSFGASQALHATQTGFRPRTKGYDVPQDASGWQAYVMKMNSAGRIRHSRAQIRRAWGDALYSTHKRFKVQLIKWIFFSPLSTQIKN
jgi:hypothetical protein